MHWFEDVYFLRKYVRYTGKIVFTPHRPEPLAQEKITLLKNKSAGEWNFPLFKRKMKEIEVYSYRQSSAFIFPSKIAMSIYRSFPGFSEYSAGKPVSL